MPIYKISVSRNKVSDADTPTLATSNSASQYARRYCFADTDAWREQSYAILLDRNCRAVGHILLGIGGFNSVTIDPKLILLSALQTNAENVILVHNHPSENPRPSQSDISETEKTKKMLSAFSIKLIDHIILADNAYFSFAEDGINEE